MRYFRILLLFLPTLITGTAFSQQADTAYTLQQCLDIAIKNNLDVKKSELQMETSRIYYQQARENLLPTLNGNVSHNINNGRSQTADFTYVNMQVTNANYNLNSSLILFNGLSLINSIRQNALAYQAGKMDFQQAKDNITLNVITAYLQILNTEDQIVQATNQLEVSRKQVERLEILNKEGNVTPAEYYNLKGQFANDQLTLINARNSMYSAKLDLLQIMNVPFNRNTRFQRLTADQLPGNYTQSENEIYNKALNDLALVKAAELRVKSAEKGVKVAQGNLFPTIAFNSGISTLYSSGSQGNYSTQFKNNYYTGLGIGISIPILNYFQNRNRVALARIDLKNAQYTDQTTKVQLKQNIEQAYINMTSALERYKVLAEQVDAYTESFRTSEVRFNSGALNSVDFVIAKGNLDRANTNLIIARYDYFIRTKILDYYQSRLSF
jgi:outer membrane protein